MLSVMCAPCSLVTLISSPGLMKRIWTVRIDQQLSIGLELPSSPLTSRTMPRTMQAPSKQDPSPKVQMADVSTLEANTGKRRQFVWELDLAKQGKEHKYSQLQE